MKIGIGGFPSSAKNYISALQSASFMLQHPDALEVEVSTSLIRAVCWDALLLPGGGDIDPALLPGNPAPDPHCTEIDPVLDREQLALLELFVLAQKPVLGICKGMQLIQLFFGGTFCQHLPTADSHCYQQYDQLHDTHTLPGSFLHQLYGPRVVVNSAHHQGAVVSAAPQGALTGAFQGAAPGAAGASQGASASAAPAASGADGLTVIQWAKDGVIEGIMHNTLPVIGLQWHPERLCGIHARPDAADGSLIFRYFLSLITALNV